MYKYLQENGNASINMNITTYHYKHALVNLVALLCHTRLHIVYSNYQVNDKNIHKKVSLDIASKLVQSHL